MRAVRMTLSAVALLLCTAFVAEAAAQEAAITGRVLDRSTQQPLTGAQVMLVGTNRGALTDADGRYRIEALEPGRYTVRANLIGYDGEDQVVTIGAGDVTQVNLLLEPGAISLDAVVVTATGQQKRRELANAVSNVDANEVVRQAPVRSVSELITGRAAGVNILQSSGTTGANARIRIRGSTSLSLSNEPIIFVDGTRISGGGDNNFFVGVGGQETSALNNINPEEIESIEIIKGPSAATLYGTDAANGVILIQTKRGGAGGAPQWNFWTEGGVLTDRNEFPRNFYGQTADGGRCFAFQVGAGSCEIDELIAFTPLEDDELSPIGTGHRQQHGTSVAGGGDGIGYFFSAEYEEEVGVLEIPSFFRAQLLETRDEIPRSQERPNSTERVSLRGNLTAQIAEDLRLSVNTNYIDSETFLPQNDNNALGVLPSAFLGNAFRTEERNFGFGFLNPAQVFAIRSNQDAQRFVGSANLNWQPAEWFVGRATVGVDDLSRNDQSFIPVGEVPFGSAIEGERNTFRVQQLNYTADVGGTANFDLNEDFTSRSSIGVQYYRDWLQFTGATGEQLGPGSESAGAGALQFADEGTTESITLGTFFEQQFGWRDRLFVTGAIRSDDNSAFGQEFDVIFYPKFGASYVAIDEQDDFFGMDWFNSLRLRTAWGAAGRAPGATDALTFFDPVTATVAGQNVPAITIGSLGDPNLKPERSQEFEAGFDAGFLDGRLGLEFTYYNKETEDLLVNRPLPPSLGVSSSRLENLGTVENRGYEVAVNAVPVAMRNFEWTINVTGSHNENELVELGLEADSILFSPQRFQEGFPLGAFFGKPVTFDDADNDGIIDAGEFEIGETAEFIGSPFPENEVSIQSAITLFDLFRVSGLLDYRGNFFQNNFTEEFRCRFAICEGLVNPDAPLSEQARALQTVLAGGGRSAAPFIEEADFWKLREMSFAFMVPDQWVSRIGASRASLVLSGRNLAIWTDYTGLDPEVLSNADQNFSTRDFLTQPPITTWTLRLNLGL